MQRATYITAGIVGGAVLVPIELIALRATSFDVIWSVTALMLVVGMLVGSVIAGAEFVVERFGVGKLGAALIRGAASIPAFAFMARTLFDGGYAATLPGASVAVYWLPLLGAVTVAGTCFVVARLLERFAVDSASWVVIGGLAAGIMVVEYANRSFFRSGYQDAHAFLLIAAVAMASIAAVRTAHLAWPEITGVTPRRRMWIVGAVAGALLINFVCVLELGLRNKHSRWTIATRGSHARHITRVLRAALDFDGDGYSALLGGGDCNDTNARINPGAVDRPLNGVDENCDGRDAEPLPPEMSKKTRATRAATLSQWLKTPAVTSRLDKTKRFHMIVLMVDALRGDIAADTEANRADFPNLFALLDDSAHFVRAFSPASGTDMGIPSILTGEIDPFKLIRQTLIEGMAAAGMNTHAVLPTEVLRWAGKTLLTRGLNSYDQVVNDRVRKNYGSHATSSETTRLGLANIDKVLAAKPDGRFWLWLHYFDVHEHAELKSSDKQLRRVLAGSKSKGKGKARKYRAVTKLVDEQIGALRRELQTRKLWEKTIVVLVSDHGESLGEDRRLPDTHGKFLYTPLVHIPLAIRVPGLKPGRSQRAIPLIDVTPTMLSLAGAQVPDDMDGRSLLPDLLPDSPAAIRATTRPILLNESDQHGVIMWPYKLLIRPKENLVELYDLANDFLEKNDLADKQPDRVRQLRQLYKSYPSVEVDRSPKARKRREKLARPPG